MESNVNMLQGSSKRYFNDLVAHQKDVGSYVNNSEAYDTVINNTGTNLEILLQILQQNHHIQLTLLKQEIME